MVGDKRKQIPHAGAYAHPGPGHKASGTRMRSPLHEEPAGSATQDVRDAAYHLLKTGQTFCEAMGHYRAALMRAGRETKGARFGELERALLIGETTAEEDEAAAGIRNAFVTSKLREVGPAAFQAGSACAMRLLIAEGMDREAAARVVANLECAGTDYHCRSQEEGPPIVQAGAVTVMRMLVDEGMEADTAAALIARLALSGTVRLDLPMAGWGDEGEPPTMREPKGQ